MITFGQSKTIGKNHNETKQSKMPKTKTKRRKDQGVHQRTNERKCFIHISHQVIAPIHSFIHYHSFLFSLIKILKYLNWENVYSF